MASQYSAKYTVVTVITARIASAAFVIIREILRSVSSQSVLLLQSFLSCEIMLVLRELDGMYCFACSLNSNLFAKHGE